MKSYFILLPLFVLVGGFFGIQESYSQYMELPPYNEWLQVVDTLTEEYVENILLNKPNIIRDSINIIPKDDPTEDVYRTLLRFSVIYDIHEDDGKITHWITFLQVKGTDIKNLKGQVIIVDEREHLPPNRMTHPYDGYYPLDCRYDLKVVVKSSDLSLACVKLESIVKLYERNWLSKDPSALDYRILALEAARQFIISNPTFEFDGIENTLTLRIVSTRDSLPPIIGIEAKFSTEHAGYGNRTGQVLPQVITEHIMSIALGAGTKIGGATIDDSWDELNQKWIEGN